MKLKQVNISQTVMINTLALQRKERGLPVFNLGAGEPVLKTPEVIKRAAELALKQNKTLYPPVAGLPQLRKSTAEWLNKSYGADFKAENILVANGGKLGLYLSLQMLLRPGDEVLIASPYWVSYPGIVKLFGGVPKIIKTTPSNGWRLTANSVRQACGRKTKILILNNANNPTGALYSKGELNEILRQAAKNNLTVISDEVYSNLVYDDGKFISCAGFAKYADRVIVIQSCSKSFAMTGWRVGFACAPKPVIEVLTSLLSQSTSGVTTISQWAAVAAMNKPEAFSLPIKKEMQKRRDVLAAELARQFGIPFAKPESSLYFFIRMTDLGIKNVGSFDFCMRLLEKTGVALIPGSACGQEGYLRFSFGSTTKTLKAGVKILAQFIHNQH